MSLFEAEGETTHLGPQQCEMAKEKPFWISKTLSNCQFSLFFVTANLVLALLTHRLLYFLWIMHLFQKFQNAILLKILEIPPKPFYISFWKLYFMLAMSMYVVKRWKNVGRSKVDMAAMPLFVSELFGDVLDPY